MVSASSYTDTSTRHKKAFLNMTLSADSTTSVLEPLAHLPANSPLPPLGNIICSSLKVTNSPSAVVSNNLKQEHGNPIPAGDKVRENPIWITTKFNCFQNKGKLNAIKPRSRNAIAILYQQPSAIVLL